MRCPSCKEDNSEGSRFCSHCSAKLPQTARCPSCKAEVLVGSKFCSACSRRLDPPDAPRAPEGQPARASGSVGSRPEAEKKSGGTSGTSFCHVCHEPTPSENLMFDVDGNRVCRKCLVSGGQMKNGRQRAIESIGQQMQAQATTRIKHLTSNTNLLPKNNAVVVRPVRRSRAPLLVGLAVLGLGLAAGGWAYFYLFQKGGLQRLAPLISLEAPKTPSGTAPTSAPRPVRLFVGAYLGSRPGDDAASAVLSFESPELGLLELAVPAGARPDPAKFEKGKAYKIGLTASSGFPDRRLLDPSAVEGDVEEAR